jgi:lipoate-protein ligase A
LHCLGVLSFSLVGESKALTSGSLETEVGEMLSPIMQGIQSEFHTNEITLDQGYLLVGNSVVGAYNTSYYFDYLLLQGVVLVRNNPHLMGLMISREGTQFASLDQLQSDVSIHRFIDAVIQSISQHLGLPMSTVPASARETDLMTELHQWKYTNDDWVFHQSEPLALGRVLLEAYLAYPPTTRCREIMAMIDDISKTYREKVECRTWLRGRGLVSWLRGIPPGLRPSGGVVQASKKNIVPAIVVEGQITYERTVPAYDDLCSIVEKAYHETFGGTSK